MGARERLIEMMGVDNSALVINAHRQINRETKVINVPIKAEHIHHLLMYPLENDDIAEINWESWHDGSIDHRLFYDEQRDILFIAEMKQSS